MAPHLKRKQFIEDIRSDEEALAALTDKWHLGRIITVA
jgi:hypothetical protein